MATRTKEADFSTRTAIITVGVLCALAAGIAFLGIRSSGHSSPAACEPLIQTLRQVEMDLQTTLSAAAKGPVDVGPLQGDVHAVEANIAANPGAFASHAYPVADALAQLIGDAQRGATSALVHTDFASIGAASLAALHYCGAPPPTAQKPGAST